MNASTNSAPAAWESHPSHQQRLPVSFWQWMAGQEIASLPLAMAPVAFALATVAVTSNINIGAAMMASMTLGQVAFAVPISAAGRRFGIVIYLRALLLLRGAAYISLAVAIVLGAHPFLLIVLAGLSGVATGAIYGSYRVLLNHLVDTARLPRAIGLSATANELIFVIGPVVAALLGSAALVLPVGVMALGALVPVLLLPRRHALFATSASIIFPPRSIMAGSIRSGRGLLTGGLAVWLLCAAAGSSTVAAIEIGAVALALHFGLAPTWAILFTVCLCVASVCGGLVVTWANRMLHRRIIAGLISLMISGAVLLGIVDILGVALLGTVFVGLALAPLATFFSLITETLVTLHRRAEGFALLRTAQGIGTIVAALLLSFLAVDFVFLITSALLCSALLVMLVFGLREQARGNRAHSLRYSSSR